MTASGMLRLLTLTLAGLVAASGRPVPVAAQAPPAVTPTAPATTPAPPIATPVPPVTPAPPPAPPAVTPTYPAATPTPPPTAPLATTPPATSAPGPTAADPMAPRQLLAAPSGIRPFPLPPQLAQGELSLAEALALALENQPQIQSRLGDYEAARQRVYQALSPILPQISGIWSGFERQTVGTSVNPSLAVPLSSQRVVTTTSRSVSTGASVSASQLLWDFGKTYAATDAARANARSSLEDIEIVRDVILFQVKQAYYDQLLASRLVVVREQALDRAQLNLKSARGFFEVGTRPKSDVTRAESDVANARVALIQAQNAVSTARIALNTAMGIAINAPTRIKDILAYEQFPTDRTTLVGEALARRPEYRQAKARSDAADATARQTFRDFFPAVKAAGTYGADRPDMNEVWSFGVQLDWSIFDGGNKVARYREALANRDAAVSRVRETELAIWQQVEQAFVSLTQSEESIGAAQKAVEATQENFRLNQGRFDAGVGTILELTTAQVDLANAQATEAQALHDYRVAIAALERALGRRP